MSSNVNKTESATHVAINTNTLTSNFKEAALSYIRQASLSLSSAVMSPEQRHRPISPIILDLNALGYSHEVDNTESVFLGLDIDACDLDLNKVISSTLEQFSRDTDISRVMETNGDIISVTFKDYNITLDREDILQDIGFIQKLERECKTALFRICYAHLQKVSGGLVGSILKA